MLLKRSCAIIISSSTCVGMRQKIVHSKYFTCSSYCILLYLCKKLCFTVSDVLFILQLYFKDKDKRPLPFISSSGLVPELRVECEEERADIS